VPKENLAFFFQQKTTIITPRKKKKNVQPGDAFKDTALKLEFEICEILKKVLESQLLLLGKIDMPPMAF
jgi:hypothetical protein